MPAALDAETNMLWLSVQQYIPSLETREDFLDRMTRYAVACETGKGYEYLMAREIAATCADLQQCVLTVVAGIDAGTLTPGSEPVRWASLRQATDLVRQGSLDIKLMAETVMMREVLDRTGDPMPAAELRESILAIGREAQRRMDELP